MLLKLLIFSKSYCRFLHPIFKSRLFALSAQNYYLYFGKPTRNCGREEPLQKFRFSNNFIFVRGFIDSPSPVLYSTCWISAAAEHCIKKEAMLFFFWLGFFFIFEDTCKLSVINEPAPLLQKQFLLTVYSTLEMKLRYLFSIL